VNSRECSRNFVVCSREVTTEFTEIGRLIIGQNFFVSRQVEDVTAIYSIVFVLCKRIVQIDGNYIRECKFFSTKTGPV